MQGLAIPFLGELGSVWLPSALLLPDYTSSAVSLSLCGRFSRTRPRGLVPVPVPSQSSMPAQTRLGFAGMFNVYEPFSGKQQPFHLAAKSERTREGAGFLKRQKLLCLECRTVRQCDCRPGQTSETEFEFLATGDFRVGVLPRRSDGSENPEPPESFFEI